VDGIDRGGEFLQALGFGQALPGAVEAVEHFDDLPNLRLEAVEIVQIDAINRGDFLPDPGALPFGLDLADILEIRIRDDAYRGLLVGQEMEGRRTDIDEADQEDERHRQDEDRNGDQAV